MPKLKMLLVTEVSKSSEKADTTFYMQNGDKYFRSKIDKNTSKTLKQQIGDMQGGMPPSKQQLKHAVHGFLKDNFTLGYYNLISGSELQLTVRSRGGKK